jgi:hypothetical protein
MSLYILERLSMIPCSIRALREVVYEAVIRLQQPENGLFVRIGVCIEKLVSLRHESA